MSDKLTPPGVLAEKVKSHIEKLVPEQIDAKLAMVTAPADGVDGLGFNLKSWDEGIYREGVVVQHNIGQAYKALVDTNSEPGTGADWERVGSNGFRWTGTKKADVEYQDGDLYIDGGTTFLYSGGKGYMVAQRGKNGKNGIDGVHGKDGADAPELIEMTIVGKDLVAVFSDGNMHTVEMPQIEEMHEVKKQLSWLEQQLLEFENIKAPIRGYEGTWERGSNYSKGDVVTYTKGLYLCFAPDGNSTGLDPDKWVQIAGSGGGGGAASSVSTKNIMDQVALNYVSIASLLATSSGAVDMGGVPKLDSNGKLDGSFLNIPGGMTLKGSIDVTQAPPAAPKAGDYYIASADGALNAGYGLGTLTTKKGDTILYTGTDWLQNQSQVDLSTVYTKSEIDNKLTSFAGGLTFLKITAAAYNALAVKDPKTLYLVSG